MNIFYCFAFCLLIIYICYKNISKQNKDIDPLTKIYNKNKFYKETYKIISNSDPNQFSLFRCDINRFKIINEVLGREFGDTVLNTLANSIKNLVKDDVGTYGRLENDIFLICIPTNRYNAKYIYDYLSDQLKHIESGFSITLCIGIYVIDNPKLPVNSMSDRASLPLKNIKGKIVDGYSYYDNLLYDSILKEQKLFYNIDSALEEHQFEIYLQPIYNLKTLKIQYAEALIRWKHPTRGLLPPIEFLPYAEKNGFIHTIDIYVLTTVCKYLKARFNTNKKIVPISVNVSRTSMLSPNLTSTLKSIVNENDIDPNYVKLEITEECYMDVSSQLLSVINELRNFGFQFFMDDFGSGYSSLGILRNIPFDIIKIDKCFIDDVNSKETSTNFLLSILNMTKTLNIPVIIEGTETKDQVDFLAKSGFDFAQGFYFSKPITFPEFEKLLEN